jgi:hypothetical protein
MEGSGVPQLAVGDVCGFIPGISFIFLHLVFTFLTFRAVIGTPLSWISKKMRGPLLSVTLTLLESLSIIDVLYIENLLFAMILKIRVL